MANDVLFSFNKNGLAEITLNQPASINSLTYHMLERIKEKLVAWEDQPDVKAILLTGAGEKGFCAGGDMKELYESRKEGEARKQAEAFFDLEYEVDRLIDDYSKPIIAYLDGVVMGGGVGLSYGASHRIVTDRTKWAMPEMNIGFFPDVGAAYFLNRAPGSVGYYLALTSTVINGAEAIYIRAADYYMPRQQYDAFLKALRELSLQEEVEQAINQLLHTYTTRPAENNKLQQNQSEIDEHFSFDSMEKILSSLEKGTTEFTKKVAQTLREKSPISLKVTLKQLTEGQEKTFAECLGMDLKIANRFMDNPDFYEGVRSVLIEKDHQPNYQYQRLSDVSDALVDEFFQ